LSGFAKVGKEFDGVRENINTIIRLLGDFDDLSDDIKISFLSEDEQKKINSAT
jgi:hypothetical protein